MDQELAVGEDIEVIIFWYIMKVESRDMTGDHIWIKTGKRILKKRKKERGGKNDSRGFCLE